MVVRRIRGIRALYALITAALTLTAVFGVQTAQAVQSVPYKINFQGRLTDASGNILANGTYNMKLRLYTAATSGTNAWEEDRIFGSPDKRVTVQNGLFNIQLGDYTALTASLFNRATQGDLWLEVELPSPATASGTSPSWTENPMTPRQSLASAAYAFNSDTVDGLDSADLAQVAAANSFSGTNTFSKSGGAGVVLSGSPASSGALLQVGSTLSSGNASGTLISANGTFTGDLLNLQVSNATKLKVDNSGNLTLASGAAITVGAAAGLASTTCTGGQVLQNQVVTGGVVTGGSCATASGGGASTILDNLGATAINASLLPNTTNSIDLGSTSKYWQTLYATTVNSAAVHVTTAGTNLTSLPLLVEQTNATGDTGLELRNSGSTASFYIAQDASNNSALTISSSSAAANTPNTITVSQSATPGNVIANTSNTVPATFTSNNTAGNAIVAAISFDTSTGATNATCSDTRGNTYTTVKTAIDGTNHDGISICYAMNIAAGANTITGTTRNGAGTATNAGNKQIMPSEYANVAATGAFDVATSNNATGTNAADNLTTGSITTNANGELIFGTALITSGGSSMTLSVGSGYTLDKFINTAQTANANITEHKVQSAAGATAATFTDSASGNTYLAVVASFKPTATVTDNLIAPLLTLTQGGVATFKNAGDTAGAFQVQNTSGNAVLSVDTLGGNVIVGGGFSSSDTTQVNLALDSTTTFAEGANTCTASVNGGALYFNSTSNALRTCISNTGWEDLVTTAGLGIIAFGVVPDSGSNAGDLPALVSPGVSGPCKVSWASATSYSVAPCVAYSGGRKVVVTQKTAVAVSGMTATSVWAHVCLTAANGQPVLSATATAENATANQPAWSASNPVLCLADILGTGTGQNISKIYDTRAFTNSQKDFVTITGTVPGLGQLVIPSGSSITQATNAGSLTTIVGVLVALSSAGASTTVPSGIIATNGPAYVKATTTTAGQFLISGATAGYASSNGTYSGTTSYGDVRTTATNTCAAAATCLDSTYVNFKSH
jgi:hypothetical protein